MGRIIPLPILVFLLSAAQLAIPERLEWVVPVHYRLSVQVDPGPSKRLESPVGVEIDFERLFRDQELPGRLDANSIRVVRYNPDTGRAVRYRQSFSYEIPYKLVGDFFNNDAGMVWWRMADSTSTHFHIYFDSRENGPHPRPPVMGLVGIGDAFYYNNGKPAPTRPGNLDWDGDGLPDRVEIGRRVWEYTAEMDDRLGNAVYFFRNVGTPEHHLFLPPVRMKSEDGSYLMDRGHLNQSMFPYDWTGNGLIDFVGLRGDSLLVMENTGMRDRNNVWILKQPRLIMDLPSSDFRDSLPGVLRPPTFYFNSLAFADWDGDGDIDMIATVGYYHETDQIDPRKGVIPYGPFLGFFELFENLGTDKDGTRRYAKPQVLRDVRGFPITTSTGATARYFDYDGDGDFDLLFTDDLDRPWAGPRLMWAENIGTREKPLFMMPVTAPPPPQPARSIIAEELYPMPASYAATWVDWDGDGVLDLVTGIQHVNFYRNIGTLLDPVFEWPVKLEVEGQPLQMPNWLDPQAEEPSHWGPQGPAESCCPVLTPTVYDWDGDGDLDLFVVGQRWQVKYFENIGTRTNPTLARGREVRVEGDRFEFSWRSRIAVGELDGDGRPEIVATSDRDNIFYMYKPKPVQTDPEALEMYIAGPLMLDNGEPVRGSYIDANNNGDNHAVLVDWDNDGDLDLINCSLYGVWYYENVGGPDNPVFRAHGRMKAGGEEIHTFNHAGACDVADWNGDGRLDLIVGSENYGTQLLFDRSFIENDLPEARVTGLEIRSGRK